MNFSPTARYYHLLEDVFIGPALQQTRIGQLEHLMLDEATDQVLIVGEGNGRFLCALLKLYPKLSVTVVDASATMLERARRRLKAVGLSDTSVEFRVADFRSLEVPTGHYHLIVTNFFFSNFLESDVEQMIVKLTNAASAGAQWLLGDFVVPARGVYRLRAKLWLWGLYRFFGWTAGVPVRELPEVDAHLTRAGFDFVAETTYCGRLLRSAAYRRAPFESNAQISHG